MNEPHDKLQRQTLHFLLVAVTLAFAWVLLPFYESILWGIVLAIIFSPVQRRLLLIMRRRRNLAAFTTLLVILFAVFIPLVLVAASLIQDGSRFYERIKSGELNLDVYFQQGIASLPTWLADLLSRFGLGDFSTLRETLSVAATKGGMYITSKVLNIGQNTAIFAIGICIMLYLLFALLRDGHLLTQKIKRMIPMHEAHKQLLFSRFTTVIRATVKGNIFVAAIQGGLGGVMFWFLGIPGPMLWGVMMALMSLLPAVGASVIWAPVAIYFLITGSIWQGVTLIAYGILVIGLIDNILRPILVGGDAQMPNYVVFISTLGGIATFGLNGFIMGPVIAALFIATWDMFSLEKVAAEDETSES
ncbi:MAG: AI-2E family transporter [Oxalobacter sp.]|nr:MAG: AI-2E family transporter [Oxalobacter sp.]